MKKTWIRKVPIVLAIAAAGVFVFSGVVMLLWNGILPPVLHIGAITLWQAAGILLLCRLLFGGMRGRRGMGGCHKRRLFMKWQQMTPEEKANFRGNICCRKEFRTAEV